METLQNQDLHNQYSEHQQTKDNLSSLQQQSQAQVETQSNSEKIVVNLENNGHLNQKQGDQNSEYTNKEYFCTECRKIVKNKCEIHKNTDDVLIPYSQVEQDFNKYKLYCEQNDPLYNIAKGLNKIKDSLKFLENQTLQADYQLKQKVFDENSKIEDFLQKIVYKGERLLIDDFTALSILDQLKKDQYLIDMIQNNYIIIKQFLNKYQQYRYENHNLLNEDLNIKTENFSEQTSEDDEIDQYSVQKRKMSAIQQFEDPNNNINNNKKKNRSNSDQQENTNLTGEGNQVQTSYNNQFYDDIQNDDTSKAKKPSIDHEVGLEYVSPKEQEVLRSMLNTQYEKHHRFSDQEKKLFAKFALLRKLKGGINVSITTEQWKLNRITVQLWIDKFKKQLKQKHEI